MQFRNYILLFAVSLLSACNFDDDNNGGGTRPSASCKVFMRASQSVETRTADESDIFIFDEAINIGGAPATRTEPDDVGDGAANTHQAIRWSDDDKFVAWAAPVAVGGEASTNYADGFNGVTFSLDHYNTTYDSADFSATIPTPMSVSNQYDYYAAYPVPSAKSGTQVTYNLPAVQSGDFNDKLDIMRASVRGCALVERDPNQISNPVWPEPTMGFEHIMHVMRIYVPLYRNLMVTDITRLEITFPENVVGGTVSFDAAKPDVAPTWNGQTNKVAIQMDENNGLRAGGRYVWVFIKSGKMSGEIKFRAYNAQGEPSQLISTVVSERDFQAQHITPISLTIPEALPPVTITFECPNNDSWPNFLGETPNAMYVKEWPAGIVALGEEDNVITSQNGKFVAKFYYEPGEVNDDLPGKSIRFGVASPSADVSHNEITCTLPLQLSAGMSQTINFATPYLFFEDFQSVGDMGNNFNGTDESYKTDEAHSLDDYFDYDGWTGNQITSTTGANIRLKGVLDGTGWGYGGYGSRVDSAPIRVLQSSKTIYCSFDYSCTTGGSRNKNYKAYMGYGGTTTEGPIKAYYEASGIGIDGSYNEKVSNDAIVVASGTNTPKSGTVKNYSISATAKTQRLSWDIYTTDGYTSDWSVKKAFYYLTLDNIRVTMDSSKDWTGKNYRSYFPNHKNE